MEDTHHVTQRFCSLDCPKIAACRRRATAWLFSALHFSDSLTRYVVRLRLQLLPACGWEEKQQLKDAPWCSCCRKELICIYGAAQLWLNGLTKVNNHPDPDRDTGTSLDVDYISVTPPPFCFTSGVSHSFAAPVTACRLLPAAPRRAELPKCLWTGRRAWKDKNLDQILHWPWEKRFYSQGECDQSMSWKPH